MAIRNPYSIPTAMAQELTLYPKKQSEQSFMRDVVPPLIKDTFPDYYFDRLQKKTKKKKYKGLPISIQNSLRELERAGKR